jgi:hypothetical protein
MPRRWRSRRRSPGATRERSARPSVWPNLEGDAAGILLAESREQAALLRSPNQIEAVMANMQKRAPTFTD